MKRMSSTLRNDLLSITNKNPENCNRLPIRSFTCKYVINYKLWSVS